MAAPHESKRALRVFVVGMRMQVAESGSMAARSFTRGVVLHRAGAERIEARIDSEGAVGERREVTHDLGLGELGQAWRTGSAKPTREAPAREGRAAAVARRVALHATARR